MGLALKAYLLLVVFSLFGTAFSRFNHQDATTIARPTALLTLSCALYAAIFAQVKMNRQLLCCLGAILVVGAACEILGVSTGLPFGRYAYTDQWWPTIALPNGKLFPLQLPFAWLLIAGCSAIATARVPSILGLMSSALLATVTDQVMEPAMTGPLNFWTWTDRGPMPGGTPISNAIGWFIVSLLAAVIVRKALQQVTVEHSRTAAFVLGGHVVLALGIAEIYRLT